MYRLFDSYVYNECGNLAKLVVPQIPNIVH